MARRFQRTYARVPVDLVSTLGANNFEQPGSIMDVSRGGLRVQTGPRLTPGQYLHVFLSGQVRPYARCRVVWAQTHGGALPSEAGLEILEHAPWHPVSRLDARDLPSQYSNAI